MNYLPDDIDFAAYLDVTDASAKVKKASLWIDDAKADLFAKREKKILLPWLKTRDVFDFRPGEVTLWAGQNGHGKSLITSQIALSLIGQDQKICIASFEMKPVTTIKRMARQFIGMNPYAEEFQGEDGRKMLTDLYDQFGDWIDAWMWFYDQQGTADSQAVLGMTKYCAAELGINHVFIDSLMKCVKGEDDYNGQKMFVDQLTSIARDMNIHVHLVHHLKKPKDENEVPDKYDSKGSGSIVDQVDNVMLVWRNKAKEEDMKQHGVNSKLHKDPDARLLCRKQRNGEHEPTVGLWFSQDAMQYVEGQGFPPIEFYKGVG
jgi:twinkle protein